ncbi:MAG: lipopolysaccharide transport system permease protein [Actinomycetota bacterium]|jgi:ABC-type polysaccharide/polyol phosphate export permease|nr:lipopolysaccharide transport system permease protein [Actinomycetota bacterium]
MQVRAAAYLLAEWAKRDFRIRYTQTLLGSLWALVQPIALTAAFVFLFRRVANINVGIPYASFVFPGMITWALFATGVSNASNAMATSMNIAAKANYPRVVAPLSAVLLPLVDLLAGLVLLPVLVVIQHPGGHLSPLRLLLSLAGCLLLAAGIGTLLSALTVFVRDIRNVVPLVLQLGLLVTPVGYPGSRLPQWLSYSPMATFVEGFRSSVVRAPAPSFARWAVAYAVTGVVLVGGFAYFHRVERRFPDVA